MTTDAEYMRRGGLVEREINRVDEAIKVLEAANPSASVAAILQRSSHQLGRASLALTDKRFVPRERVDSALSFLREAKGILADAVAWREEEELRASWGEARWMVR